MRKPDPAASQLAEMHGAVIALECFTTALCQALSPKSRGVLSAQFERVAELSRTLLLNSGLPDDVIDAFERTLQRQGEAMNPVTSQTAVVARQVDRGAKVIGSRDRT